LRDESRDSRERLFARDKQTNKELSRGSPRAWRIKLARKSVATTISVDGEYRSPDPSDEIREIEFTIE